MEFDNQFASSKQCSSSSLTASPLEVLSNAAAALLENNKDDEHQSNHTSLDQQNQMMHSSTISKELPTREYKIKRSKDRRELAHSSSFRTFKTRTNSPTQIITEESMHSQSDASEHSFSSCSPPLPLPLMSYTRSNILENSLNSNGLSYHLPVHVGLCQRERNYRGSPYQMPITNGYLNVLRRNSDPSSLLKATVIQDDEQPLDMSKKKCQSSNENESQKGIVKMESHSEPSSPPFNAVNKNDQMTRPSVITCASTLLKSQSAISKRKDCNCSTTDECMNDDCKNMKDKNNYHHEFDLRKIHVKHSNRNHHGSNRLEIVSGMSDPVIDEHFRRSLGKDYSEIFSSTTANNASITVDDHFAKALGDTWLRLQNATDSSSKKSPQSIVS